MIVNIYSFGKLLALSGRALKQRDRGMRQAERKRGHDNDGAIGMGLARSGGELPLLPPAAAGVAHGSASRQGKRAMPRRSPRSPQAEHREAAWRLSRAIRRAPGPAAQARIGGLVCGHLRAMLREGRENEGKAQAP